jgi:hypothetical protein
MIDREAQPVQTQASVYRKLVAAAAAALACVLAACGGGESVAGIEGSGAPVATTVTTTGTITGFGSIFVDGVEYATSSAQIRIDDQSSTESQLRVGHVVTIKGQLNANGTSGTATDVAFNSDVRGPVTAIDIANKTLTVLGQTVRVADDTLLDEALQPAEISSLQPGASVQVSGFANAAEELVASRIDLPAANSDLRVRGKVKSLDVGARTFRVNALTVDFSGAAVTGSITEGVTVKVQGTALTTSGGLVATQVSVVSPPAGAANEKGQVEGFITTFTSTSDFVVSSQRVLTDSSTQFVLQGGTLAANVFVKVRGTYNASGALVASKVEAKQQSASLVRGVVEAVSGTAGTLRVLGIDVTTTASTTLEDRSNEHKRPFRLSDLRTGDYVEVRGNAPSNGGTLAATLVERDRPEDRSHVQGVATNLVAPNFTVLGITVATDAQTRFLGLGGGQRAAAEFFSEAPNRVVKVRGTLSGDTLIADQVRIEK